MCLPLRFLLLRCVQKIGKPLRDNMNPRDNYKNSRFKTLFVATLGLLLKMGLTALKTAVRLTNS